MRNYGIFKTLRWESISMLFVLLAALFGRSTQGADGDGNSVLHCPPRNLTLSRSEQTILLTWKDNLLCSDIKDTLVFELVALIAGNQVHYDEVAITPDQVGASHSWSWTSHLALECASYAVRISSRYKNQKSSWTLQRTLEVHAGKKYLRAEVFPKDGIFNVGSSVTFCCILPNGTSLSRINIEGNKDDATNVTMINSQTYALTVLLNQKSKNSCTNVYCDTKSLNGATVRSGACAYIDNAPEDENLQCETRDLKLAECRWNVGNNTNLGSTKKEYWLQGRECKEGSQGRCSIEIPPHHNETKWTLIVRSKLGKVELTDTADMTRRVHMYAPEVVVSHVNARNVRLKWKWSKQHYSNLNIMCQVNVSSDERHVTSEHFGGFAVLKNLIPNWTYSAAVRCGISNHLWKWGDWSLSVPFNTKGDVPDPLDVWMQMEESEVIITWKKPLNNQSHGNIIDYTVTWESTKQPKVKNRTTVPQSEQQYKLPLNTSGELTVTVTARNTNGSSPPSTLIIPSSNTGNSSTQPSKINGSGGGFSPSWTASPKASCGYIVDWCPTVGNCSVEWIKLRSNETEARIFSKNLKNGVRYTISIYACTQHSPYLWETQEGYVQEETIKDGLFEQVKIKQLASDVEVSWSPVRLTEQSAFIRGYVLYWSDSKSIFNESTDNPEATSLTATNLKSDFYTFTLKAQTLLGECGTTRHSATIDSPVGDNMIKTITISLVTFSGLLFLLTFLCYRYWTCIKWKFYPPIPKPVLIDKWLTSPVGHHGHHIYVDQFRQNEADVMDVPELYLKSGSPGYNIVSQEKVPFVNTQTPKGYYNQPLKKYTPPSLIFPPMTIPSQSELPTSSFSSVYPNLSYNLIMQTGSQLSVSEFQFQEVPSSDSSGGYQPQAHTETFTLNQTQDNSGEPITCINAYIMVPS